LKNFGAEIDYYPGKKISVTGALLQQQAEDAGTE